VVASAVLAGFTISRPCAAQVRVWCLCLVLWLPRFACLLGRSTESTASRGSSCRRSWLARGCAPPGGPTRRGFCSCWPCVPSSLASLRGMAERGAWAAQVCVWCLCLVLWLPRFARLGSWLALMSSGWFVFFRVPAHVVDVCAWVARRAVGFAAVGLACPLRWLRCEAWPSVALVFCGLSIGGLMARPVAHHAIMFCGALSLPPQSLCVQVMVGGVARQPGASQGMLARERERKRWRRYVVKPPCRARPEL
jgi:hypothetical protein